MKVLVACECSCIVRDEFLKLGHDALSCDLQFPRRPGPHIKDDVLKHLDEGWDLMIGHPPCTYLANSSNFKRNCYNNYDELVNNAKDFFLSLYNANIPHIACENPPGKMTKLFRKCDQTIHPWQFGHPYRKPTSLWLKNLPKLIPTKILPGPFKKFDTWSTNPNRTYLISKTFPGIVRAMAEQWGSL